MANLVFLLLGLSNGATFAALAVALLVNYRSSGVINFATGSIALFTAYVYAFLRMGQFLILIPGLPETARIGPPMGFWPALVLALLAAALLGLVLHLAIFRFLRTAPPLAKAVASLGVSVVITGVIFERVGSNAVVVSSIFPTHIYTLGAIRVSSDRIWFAVTVVAIALVLTAAFRFTRFGLHTRAAANTERGAYLSGISPERIAMLNWMVSAAVAGLAGILIAPIVPLEPISYTLFIVPALAAAIIGRFQFAAVAVVAGLLIGMVQSELAFLESEHSWLPSSGLPELVPLILILLVLVIRARPLPTRGALTLERLGRAPRPRKIAVPAVTATMMAFVALALLHGVWRFGLVTSLIMAVISLSLVVVIGYAGQVSLAQLTLAGVAGFLLGPMTTSWGVPFPLAPLLAAVAAAVVGVVVSLPATRIRGLPVAVVTLSMAVAVEALWFNNPNFVGEGGVNIAGPKLFGLNLGVGAGAAYPRMEFCLVVLLVLVVVAVSVAKLRLSRLGSAMLAVRSNERSAAAAGIDVVRVKVIAFAIGAFIAGLGGTLLAYSQTNVTSANFDAVLGLSFLATVYLAGITSVSGGILAGIISVGGITSVAINQWWPSLNTVWYQVAAGVGLVLTIILNPEGVISPIHIRVERLRERWGRSEQAPPSIAATPRRIDGARAARSVVLDLTAPPVLSLDKVSVAYGGVVAVDEVSFSLPPGAIVGLIGPNGAGKTTLIDAVNGFTDYTGNVILGNVPLDGRPPHRRVRSGLGRTFQAIELWNDLTVDENVRVGLAASQGRNATTDIDPILALLGLEEMRQRAAGELSQGNRQMVSIARALVGRPSVLLLDEPAAGLDPSESEWLAERLHDIRETGVTLLLVDHDMSLVLSLCDRINVLNFGQLIASGTPTEIRRVEAVTAAYLGSETLDTTEPA